MDRISLQSQTNVSHIGLVSALKTIDIDSLKRIKSMNLCKRKNIFVISTIWVTLAFIRVWCESILDQSKIDDKSKEIEQ